MYFRRILALTLALILTTALAVYAGAEEACYYMPDVPLNAAKDSGFIGTDSIDSDDPHYGWTLGRFYLTGFTQGPDTLDTEDLVFLKNADDTVALYFQLEQELDKLNGRDDLRIAYDEMGFDGHFGTEKTSFGHGALFIRRTDHQNAASDPIKHYDYLSGVAVGARTEVYLFEEGDYEVALDYSVKYAPLNVFGSDLFPQVEDYRIFFRFSIRNGNCMVFPFDLATGAELSNGAITSGGFSLDLARSRYLDIQVKRSVMTDSPDGPVADIRFNGPARDGDQYTQEGIYTITVRNRYTREETVKTIYVGTAQQLQGYLDADLLTQEQEALLCTSAGLERSEPAEVSVQLLLWCGVGAVVLAAVITVLVVLGRRRGRSLQDYDGQRWW